MVDVNPIVGYETYTEYVAESTWKTTPTNPTMKWFGAVKNVSVKPTEHKFEEYFLNAASSTHHRRLRAIVDGLEEFTVGVEFEPQPIGGGYSWLDVLALAIGAISGDDDDLASFTLNRVSRGYNFVMRGCRIKSMGISIVKDAVQAWNFEAQGGSMSTTALPIGTGTHAVDPQTKPMTWANAYMTLGGSELNGLREIELNFENNLIAEPRIRSTDARQVAFIKEGPFKVSGSLSFDFLNQDRLTELLAGTEIDLALVMDGKTITFSDAKWKDAVPYEAKPEDLIGEKIPFTALAIDIA